MWKVDFNPSSILWKIISLHCGGDVSLLVAIKVSDKRNCFLVRDLSRLWLESEVDLHSVHWLLFFLWCFRLRYGNMQLCSSYNTYAGSTKGQLHSSIPMVFASMKSFSWLYCLISKSHYHFKAWKCWFIVYALLPGMPGIKTSAESSFGVLPHGAVIQINRNGAFHSTS